MNWRPVYDQDTTPGTVTRANAKLTEEEEYKKLMWEMEVKDIPRRKRQYQSDCQKFTKFLFDRIGSNLVLQCRLDPAFESAYEANEVAALWNILKKICTTSSLEDYDDIKSALYRIDQGKRTLASYCLDLEDKVSQLATAAIVIKPEEERDIFMAGLNKDIYGNRISEMKFDRANDKSTYPANYSAAKQMFRLWSDAHGITGGASAGIKSERIMISKLNTFEKRKPKVGFVHSRETGGRLVM